MADNTGLNYTKIESFVKWISANLAGILSNDQVNSYDIQTEQESIIKEALLHGEGKVNGALRKRGYKTPIDPSYTETHNVLKMYVRNIAVFELYGRRGITKERYYKYTRAMEELRAISRGDDYLPDDLPTRGSQNIVHGNRFESVFSETGRTGV